MAEESLKPFKVGDIIGIQSQQSISKKKDFQGIIFNFPYLEAALDKENGNDEIKTMYQKSYHALEELDKTTSDLVEKEKINKVMKAYDKSMVLIDELVKIRQELVKTEKEK